MKFIKFPNGDTIAKDSIKAVRRGDAQPKSDSLYLHEAELKPRVIVDFVIGSHGNCIVLDCESIEQRDALAATIEEQLSAP